MRSTLRTFLFLVMALGSAAPARADTATDFERFVGLWAGNFDNLKQATAQDAAGVPVKERNQPTLLFIRKVDLPAFGSEVFYAEWRDGKNPDKVTRQRIYALEIDATEKKLRLNLHIWPADKPEFVARTTGAHRDVSKLAGVTPADMAGLKGCDVFFDVAATEFSGAMKKGACAFPAPDGTPIYSWSQMKIDDKTFSYLDGWFRLDNTPFMQFTREWFVFERKN